MPLPRYERLANDKKRKLLLAATTEFATKGYEAASLNDILEAAELGKSSYYYYFADKEDLYSTVIEDAWHRLTAENPQPRLETLDAASVWPAFEAFVAQATAALVGNAELIALVGPLQSMWQTPTPRLAAIIEKMKGELREVIAGGQRLGCVRTDLAVEELLSLAQSADRALDELLLRQGDLSPQKLETHSKLVIDTFRRLLEPARLPRS